MKISAIIPVYNAEKTVSKTIESIVNQSYKNIEIIIVDDGSSDGSAGVCQEWVTRDKRIKLYEKENAGVSGARNFGMQHCTGEFLLFIDADDYLVSEAIEKYVQVEKKRDSDIVFAEYLIVDELINKKEIKKDLPLYSDSLQEDIIYKLLKVYSNGRMLGTVWRSLIRKKLLKENNILFDCNLKMSEDAKFILTVVNSTTKIDVLPMPVYCYVRNAASVTQKYMKCMYNNLQSLMDWKEEVFSCKKKPYKDVINISRAYVYVICAINLNRSGTSLTLSERVTWCKKEYIQNRKNINLALRYKNELSASILLGCILFKLKLFGAFILVHALHNHTIK